MAEAVFELHDSTEDRLANGHIQCNGHNSALLTMAVGQMVLVFSLSRGDAPGYVERGLWPNEGAVNAGGRIDR